MAIANLVTASGLKVLIVEDDKTLQTAISDSLELENIQVTCASSAEEALEILKTETIHMVISDINMPKMSGEDLLIHIRQEYPYLPVMLMTAYSSIDRAVKAIQRGAVDYLAKPFSLNQLTAKVKQYSQSIVDDYQADQPIMVSAESKSVFAMAAKVAQSNANILISGESGTGKEVLARYVHDNSPRQHKSFIAINCAAIPENMLEAILFGHEKGSFTGAHKAMPGKFEMADGGTLLLDEITEMPLSLQAKILRVLQEKEVERIGGKEPISIDVRIIATTNRDIQSEIAAKHFREDLYYRINVFPIHWKPLRERREDIIPLAESFLNRHVSSKVVKPLLAEDARLKLISYDWPGNVRELDNVIQRALVMAQADQITAEDLMIQLQAPAKAPAGLNQLGIHYAYQEEIELKDVQLPVINEEIKGATVNLNEKNAFEYLFAGDVQDDDLRTRELKMIIDCLQKNNGNRKKTAEVLGISPRTLRYKIAKIKESWPNLSSI